MKTYFEAYQERLRANDRMLRDLGKKLQNLGFTVEIPVHNHGNKSLLAFITIYDKAKENGVRVSFREVPYRWTFSYDRKPDKDKGSGFIGKEYWVDGIEDFPFSVQDVIDNFKPMYVDKRFAKYYTELD